MLALTRTAFAGFYVRKRLFSAAVFVPPGMNRYIDQSAIPHTVCLVN